MVLALFAVAFYLVLHHKEDQSKTAAGGPGGRRAFGTVTITTGTATKGNIGVYLNAIGTVTPVYTTSVVAQASGVVTAVNYREGQVVRKGDPLIDIEPRIYQAQVTEAEGTLEKDTNELAAGDGWTWSGITAAWARNAIPKQTSTIRKRSRCRMKRAMGKERSVISAVQPGEFELAAHIVSPINWTLVGLRLSKRSGHRGHCDTAPQC